MKGRVERTRPLFSNDETTEVGCDAGEPVSEDYPPRDNAFSGKVNWVQIDIDTAAKDADHMIGGGGAVPAGGGAAVDGAKSRELTP